MYVNIRYSYIMDVLGFKMIQNTLKGGAFPTNRNSMEIHKWVCLDFFPHHITSYHTLDWAFSWGNNDGPLGVWVLPTCSDPYHDCKGGNWYWGQGLLVELTLSARLGQGWYRPAREAGRFRVSAPGWEWMGQIMTNPNGTTSVAQCGQCGNAGPSQRHRHWWCNPARWCHTSAMNAALKPAMVESVRPSSTNSPLGWKPQEVGSRRCRIFKLPMRV